MCKADFGNDPLAELILFDNLTESWDVTYMYLELLKERNLPPLQSREDMLKVLQEEEYGFLPPAPEDLTWEIKKNVVPHFTCEFMAAAKISECFSTVAVAKNVGGSVIVIVVVACEKFCAVVRGIYINFLEFFLAQFGY